MVFALRMNQGMLFDHLKKPGFYGPDVTEVRLLQTHISYVALTGTYAYKVKKPVNFGFLDFSTLDKRKYFCEEELRLNRRLSPEIYLDVLPITRTDSTLELNGSGPVVDYALKMKEFPQEQIMTTMLKRGEVTEESVDQLCERLIAFYTAQQSTEDITRFGEVPAVKQNIDENFEQTKPMIDITVPKDTFQFISEAATRFLEKRKTVFKHRMQDGRILDCHGDLHSGNIVITKRSIQIFDCIEFNERFRFIDVASDIGFLAMDLDYQNYPYLSSHLIQEYVKRSGDQGIYEVLNFYKSYRAYVRGKVHGFQLNDPHISPEVKQDILLHAKKYFALSKYYAELFSLDLKPSRQLVFVVSGLTGTGKSTVAQKLAVDYHARQINTDVVRKQYAGIEQYERHHDEFHTGLYSPENIDKTYEQVMGLAARYLKKKENVVLDATFQKKSYRDLARALAQKHHAAAVFISCVCPDDVVKRRLEERLKKKSVSDGRWEIYRHQQKTFESFSTDEPFLTMDTSNESYEYRMFFLQTLLTRVNEVA
jgi:aminoglycoside phosphotransferase family enzyme/predicted kinase